MWCTTYTRDPFGKILRAHATYQNCAAHLGTFREEKDGVCLVFSDWNVITLNNTFKCQLTHERRDLHMGTHGHAHLDLTVYVQYWAVPGLSILPSAVNTSEQFNFMDEWHVNVQYSK